MARLSRRDNRTGPLLMNALGAVVVGFTLLINVARGQPIASVAAALLIAAALHRLWVRAGRPRGIADAVAEAEHHDD